MKIALWCIAMYPLMQCCPSFALPPQPTATESISPNAVIYLKRDQCREFDSAFQAISQQSKVTIISEGLPLIPILSDKKLLALDPQMFGVPLSLERAVQQIAMAYDYDAERTDSKTFLLRKRYSDPNDLPCVTCEEVMSALSGMLKISKPFNPSTAQSSNDNPAVQFAKSLTLQQLEDIKTTRPSYFNRPMKPETLAVKKQGISITKLNPHQQEIVVIAAGQMYLHDKLMYLQLTLNHLRTLQNKQTVFCWLDIKENKVFGYKGPFAPTGVNWDFPLSSGYISDVGGSYTRLFVNNPRDVVNNAITDSNSHNLVKIADLTTPTQEDIARVTSPYQSKYFLTLGEVGTLNISGSGSKAQSDLVSAAVIDENITQKPVCVFGASFSNQEALLRSISVLYGLLLIKQSNNKFTLTVKTPRNLKTIADLPTEFERLTPEPMRRALSAQADRIYGITIRKYQQSSGAINPSTVTTDRSAELRAQSAQKNARQLSWNQGAMLYYFPATRLLRAYVQPKVPSPVSTPFPASSLGNEERKLVALMMFSNNCWKALHFLTTSPPPQCLVNPETMYVRCDVSSDNKVTSFNVGYLDASGNFRLEYGQGLIGLESQSKAPAGSK